MANKDNKNPENVKGNYYVDMECIACGICVNECPNCFAFTKNGQYAYIKKQAENEEEISSCNEAMTSCPVEAIGYTNE